MQQIPLSQGQFAIVDDADFPLLSAFRWMYRAERNGRQGYAVRHHKVDGKDRLCYMHRQLMQPGAGQEVIFLNHDRLDYRRENLRVVSKEEARRHHRVRSDSRSGVKGVRYNPEFDTWSAQIYRHGHCYSLGTFRSQQEAVAAYERELQSENPDLHTAPATVARPAAETLQQANPDQTEQNDAEQQ